LSGAGVGALVAELEGALIPVNRGAARRTLARIARETSRAGVSARPRRRAPVVELPPLAPARVALAPVAPPQDAFLTPPPAPVALPAPLPAFLTPPPAAVARASTPELSTPPPVIAAAPPSLPPEPSAMPVVESALPPSIDELTDPCAVALEPSDAQTLALPVATVLSPDVTEHTVPLEFGAAAPPPARYDAPAAQCIVVPPPMSEPMPRSLPVPPLDAPVAAVAETSRADESFVDEPEIAPEPTPFIDVSVGTPIDSRAASAAPVVAEPVAVVAEPVAVVAEPVALVAEPVALVAQPVVAEPVAIAAEPAGPRPRSRVDELLDTFRHSDALDERALSGALKRVAGLEPTPPPPAVVMTAAPAPVVLVAPPDVPDSPRPYVASPPPPPAELPVPRAPRAPRLTSTLLTGMLLLGIAAIVFAWVRFPWLFTGR
jgi:hypothetical protein